MKLGKRDLVWAFIVLTVVILWQQRIVAHNRDLTNAETFQAQRYEQDQEFLFTRMDEVRACRTMLTPQQIVVLDSTLEYRMLLSSIR